MYWLSMLPQDVVPAMILKTDTFRASAILKINKKKSFTHFGITLRISLFHRIENCTAKACFLDRERRV